MESKVIITDISYTLEELLKDIWNQLFKATQKKTAFSTPTLCTHAVVDEGLEARVLVLREVLPATRQLICHTDLRSSKIEEIQAHPWVSWHFWDARKNLQIRLKAQAQIHHQDDFAQAQWDKTSTGSLKIYATDPAPGTETAGPMAGLPAGWEDKRLERSDVEVGKKNFAVISTEVYAVDWLWLGRAGHRRARFAWQAEAGALVGSWVIP